MATATFCRVYFDHLKTTTGVGPIKLKKDSNQCSLSYIEQTPERSAAYSHCPAGCLYKDLTGYSSDRLIRYMCDIQQWRSNRPGSTVRPEISGRVRYSPVTHPSRYLWVYDLVLDVQVISPDSQIQTVCSSSEVLMICLLCSADTLMVTHTTWVNMEVCKICYAQNHRYVRWMG